MSFRPEGISIPGQERDAYGFLESERNAYATAFVNELGGRAATDEELNFLEANGAVPDYAGSVRRLYGGVAGPAVEGYRPDSQLAALQVGATQVKKYTDDPEPVGFGTGVGIAAFSGAPLYAISAAQAAAAQAVARQIAAAGQPVNGPPRTASGLVQAGPISIPLSMSMDIQPGGGSFPVYTSVGSGVPTPTGSIWGTIGSTLVNAGVNALGQYVQHQLTGGGAVAPAQGGPPPLPQGGMGGQGGINLPQSGGPGNVTAGGIVMTAHGPRMRVTYPATQKTGVRTVDRKVTFGKYGWQLAARRMNVLNPHALRRSFHRISGFESFAAGALKFFGYHVTGHAKKHSKKRGAFGKRKRR